MNSTTPESQLSDRSKPVRRVLFVDDDRKLLKAFQLYLSRFIDVSVVYSGDEALKMLQEESFSVVVSDMHMPSMTGVEFINRAKEVAPKVVYMLLTASQDNQTAVDAFNKAGVFCVIKKPCPLKDLADFIEAAQAESERL
jgi:DNA-binding NtrC family response regulator